ncbi:UNVERIFIED_CONTAM: hypothetical protein GTU68_002429 [Idotea baltica]|nr:hypothetical protein [Idotea baltica]
MAKTPDEQTTDVVNFLNAENDYKEAELAHLKDFRANLFEEIKGRIKEEDQSVPYKSNGYFYYTRYEEGQNYPIYCRKKGNLNAQEIVLLNVNDLALGHSYYNVDGRIVSPNNKLMSYGVDTVSRRIYTIKFKNLETGEILNDELPNATSSLAWASDNKTVFYTLKEEGTLRSFKIMRHVLGTPTDEDVEIYHEKDEQYGVYCYRSKSGDYIMLGAYSTLASEIYYLNANKPYEDFKVIEPRVAQGEKHEYSVQHYGDYFYISTNLNAENFFLVKAPINNPNKENWEEIISHRSDVLLQDFDVFSNFLVLNERVKGVTELRIIPWKKTENTDEHYIQFPDASHLIYASVNRDFETDILRFGYTSLTTPNSTYDYNMKTREKVLLKQQTVVSDTFNPDNYTSERVYATAKDGTKIPVSMVYKKGTPIDGSAPCLQYAYGSYGSSTEPYFSSVRLSLLDRGFVYAIAHIRGGSEMGRHWYEDGKMFNKMNTFTDFTDCSDFLIENKYTDKDKLFALGGSAGGLLMGAIINQRPELYRGIVAAVPFVDVISTMLDETIPLTTGEFNEWGNPKIKAQYEYIKTYSPYDNVVAQDYPNMLITTGYHDSQVQYWEPAKWVAKLRELKTDNNQLFLHTNMEFGHSGASGRFDALKETALEFAFFFDLVGIKE